MNPTRLLTTPSQQGAVDQMAAHGLTYWWPLAVRLNMSAHAAHGVLGALAYRKLAARFPLFDGTSGYRLTRYACGLLSLPVSLARGRGEQSAVFRVARLVDCARRRVEPWRPGPLVARYPELAEFADQADRFVPGVGIELTLLHVDHGGGAERALSRVNALAGRYLRHPQANRLVLSGRLGVRLLTASPGKAEAIARRFTRAAADPLCRVELDVVEDLAHLLAGRVGP